MQRIFLALLLIVFLIVSCKLKEDVTDPDTDTTDEELTVVFPNGNDSLMVGANYNVLWESSIQSALVLEYSTDNGSNWIAISDSVDNTGTYSWGPVPNTKSSKCFMRVRTADGTSSDVSDTTWSIIENDNKVLILTSPLGGEVIEQGSSLTIEWISSKISTVHVEFSPDNGTTWQTVITNYDAEQGSYTWNDVPAVNTTNGLIRISDVSNATISDVMGTTFSILIDTNLMLLSPNGGEEIEGGTEYEVSWFSKDVSSIMLEFTTNNGVDWTTIVDNQTNTGVYYWNPVPSTPSKLAKLRITDKENSDNVDESDTTFTILPEADINITSPTGNSSWKSGDKEFITWVSKNVARVKIEYTVNNGSDWVVLAESEVSDGSYLWEPIPEHNTSLANIRISDAEDGKPFAMLDDPFTIFTGEDVLEVYSPNGGEAWEIGTEQEITWFAFGVTSLDIDYTTNNGQSWETVAESIPNNGSYFWSSIPNTPSSLAKVRIRDAADAAPSDESDATFKITQESQIEVTSPNGGEQLQAGSSANITWTSTNIENVKIEFTSNGGATWSTLTESTESVGLFQWENIPDVSSQQCLIKISDASDGIPSDESNANFIITNQVVETISLVSPSGSAEWQSGTQQEIAWTSSAIDSITIEYSLNGGSNWTVIEDAVEAGTGGYTWNPVVDVPDFRRNSKIKISDAEDGSPFVESEAFTIRPIPSLTITAPSSGDEFPFDSTVTFEWQSIGVEKVTIEVYSNGIFDTVAIGVQNNFMYNYNFPQSGDYRVKVSDANFSTPSDISGTFTVLPQIIQSINVVQPNGGENWLTSKDAANPNYHEIQWTSNNVSRVDIMYTLDGGANWETIVEDVPSNGLYNWRVPENIQFRTDLARIKIVDAANENLFDETDGFFTIHPQVKFLRIDQPFGDEYFLCNDDLPDWLNTVTWTSAGISHVKIEYSYNNGATWIELESSFESSGAYGINPDDVGQFVYDADSNLVFIADNPTSQARIRITDATPPGVPFVPEADPSVVDVSEQFNLGICPAASAPAQKPKSNGLKPNSQKVGRKN